jgi:hypothetical protein
MSGLTVGVWIGLAAGALYGLGLALVRLWRWR